VFLTKTLSIFFSTHSKVSSLESSLEVIVSISGFVITFLFSFLQLKSKIERIPNNYNFFIKVNDYNANQK